jgi:hypothetical protein
MAAIRSGFALSPDHRHEAAARKRVSGAAPGGRRFRCQAKQVFSVEIFICRDFNRGLDEI